MHVLSSPSLLERREQKHQFSTFDNGGRESNISAAGLLKGITTSPRVALYVEDFAITSWRDRWENEEKAVNTPMAFDPQAEEEGRRYRHTPYAEEDLKLLERAVEPVVGGVESLVEGIKGGSEDPIIALSVMNSDSRSCCRTSRQTCLKSPPLLRHVSRLSHPSRKGNADSEITKPTPAPHQPQLPHA